ncbi:hypothetical protein JL101_021465 [Skermanella rosea]|uniref:hypothetical protein n=1 Tax=Skermanella rosea TaxID=1817965 RepID=UPI00193142A9|nr:hypothetical protein [Skermanella rosea]UEM02535.1 hypothetical protein JL101_021465 [Skermanella rosea]
MVEEMSSVHRVHPPSYETLLDELLAALGFPDERRPLLIAIDGRDGAGKSSLASWLSWQLNMPSVNLDLFLTGKGLHWRIEDLARLLETRCATKPLIVEGIFVLEILSELDRTPDFTVFVDNQKNISDNSLMADIRDYWRRYNLPESATYKLIWAEPDCDTIETAKMKMNARIGARISGARS